MTVISSPPFSFTVRGQLWEFTQPVVMGIMNLTPDSFYADSRILCDNSAIQMAEKMIQDGAKIIDIGGQSSRPGATQIDEDTELKRVIPTILLLKKHFPEVLLSIDTFYARVAKEAIDAGAHVVNDISAGDIDREMIPTVASLSVPYCIMHMKGKPEYMQKDTHYKHVKNDVTAYLISRKKACMNAGILDIWCDPGFGFGKSIEHNYELLQSLKWMKKTLASPLLVGVSRKSMITKPLGILSSESLSATTAIHLQALINGASILRVHDVKEAVQSVILFQQLRQNHQAC
jgi:dihydropteroate synthase